MGRVTNISGDSPVLFSSLAHRCSHERLACVGDAHVFVFVSFRFVSRRSYDERVDLIQHTKGIKAHQEENIMRNVMRNVLCEGSLNRHYLKEL